MRSRKKVSLKDELEKLRNRDSAGREEVEEAEKAASEHHHPVYSTLTYTEKRPEWVLLWKHMQRGQISPEHLRDMETEDLEYIAAGDMAGLTFGSPGEVEALPKIKANIARATRELARRAEVRTRRIIAFAGVAGAFIGGLISIIATKSNC